MLLRQGRRAGATRVDGELLQQPVVLSARRTGVGSGEKALAATSVGRTRATGVGRSVIAKDTPHSYGRSPARWRACPSTTHPGENPLAQWPLLGIPAPPRRFHRGQSSPEGRRRLHSYLHATASPRRRTRKPSRRLPPSSWPTAPLPSLFARPLTPHQSPLWRAACRVDLFVGCEGPPPHRQLASDRLPCGAPGVHGAHPRAAHSLLRE